jgi:prepilin-type N-terminal cleavage/methylation domain-containing protein
MTKALASLRSSVAARGFTLTELAIVLGIIGIILGAIWSAAAMVYENNRTKAASTQVLTLANNWKSVYGSKRMDVADGTDLTATTINNNFMPQEMIQAGVTTFGVGPWTGSQVNVFADQTNNGIAIKYSNLTESACNHFANAVAAQNGQLIIANINGTSRSFPPLGNSLYFTPSDFSALCTPASTNFVQVTYAL